MFLSDFLFTFFLPKESLLSIESNDLISALSSSTLLLTLSTELPRLENDVLNFSIPPLSEPSLRRLDITEDIARRAKTIPAVTAPQRTI